VSKDEAQRNLSRGWGCCGYFFPCKWSALRKKTTAGSVELWEIFKSWGEVMIRNAIWN